MFNLFDGNEPPANDGVVLKKIMEKTNVDLQINWAPGGNYTEKVTALLASGDLPSLLTVTDNKAPTVVSAVEAGAFWELGPYLKDYPNLSKINPLVLDNIKLDGKLYSIPKTRPIVKDGIILRQDWLDNLGLQRPQSLDELYNVIKAFTLNDPDGNGKNDTIGLAELKGLTRFNYLVTAIGGGNEWDSNNGKLTPTMFSDEYFQVLDFYRKLYAEKLMNQDFALIDLAGVWEYVNKNKAGMFFSDPEQITYFEELKKIEPKARMGTYAGLEKAKKGSQSILNKGLNASYYIPKSSVKTEADLKRVLKFLDDLCSDDLQNLFVWGVEGVHYSMENGKAKRTPAQNDAYQAEIYRWERGLRIRDIGEALPGVLNPDQQEYQNVVADMAKKLVPNPAITFISPTLSQKGGELNKIWTDARIKYILGEIDKNGWNKALEQWSSSGGAQVIKEMNDLYAKK